MRITKGFALATAVVFACAIAPAFSEQAAQPPKPPAAEKAAKPAKPPVTGKINVNTASAEQLAMLPGVSLKKAQALVDYRAKNGTFKNIDELQAKTKLKQRKMDKLKEYLIFDGETTLQQIK
jgi:competence protein ComEA